MVHGEAAAGLSAAMMQVRDVAAILCACAGVTNGEAPHLPMTTERRGQRDRWSSPPHHMQSTPHPRARQLWYFGGGYIMGAGGFIVYDGWHVSESTRGCRGSSRLAPAAARSRRRSLAAPHAPPPRTLCPISLTPRPIPPPTRAVNNTRATSPVILVTMNYRVSTLGWLAGDPVRASTPDGSAGNFGLQDVRLCIAPSCPGSVYGVLQVSQVSRPPLAPRDPRGPADASVPGVPRRARRGVRR